MVFPELLLINSIIYATVVEFGQALRATMEFLNYQATKHIPLYQIQPYSFLTLLCFKHCLLFLTPPNSKLF